MDSENIVVAVGLSSRITTAKLVGRRLDHLLSHIDSYKVLGVNDSKGIVKAYCNDRSIDYSSASCRNIVEGRRIVSKVSHVVVFWTGRDGNELIFAALTAKSPYKIVPFPITTVANKDKQEEFDIYIGRGGPWGNPFPIVPGTSETREVVIERYREYFESEILTNADKHRELLSLRGLRLGCHCKPSACHGDVIAEYLNRYTDEHDVDSVELGSK